MYKMPHAQQMKLWPDFHLMQPDPMYSAWIRLRVRFVYDSIVGELHCYGRLTAKYQTSTFELDKSAIV